MLVIYLKNGTFFQNLSKISGLFEQVKVDLGGYGVTWNDEIDLSCNQLWENGYEI